MTEMNRITKVELRGYRRLHDLRLTMPNFMVMIGANGVGKSSLLDVFSLLSAMASGKMNSFVSQLGGVDRLLTRDKSEAMSFCVDMKVPNYEPLKYNIVLSPSGNGYVIVKEELSQEKGNVRGPFFHIKSENNDIRYYELEKEEGKDKKAGLVRPTWEHNSMETSLSQVPKMFQQPEALRRIFSTAVHYHVLDVGPRAPIKLPQPVKPADTPGENGEDLISYLYNLRESSSESFERILDTLRAAFPDFENLTFPSANSGMLAMAWKSKNYRKPCYAFELSEGTLRFIWLTALLQCSNLPMLTMIDEPETSLHPELNALLVDLMREASERTQLVVATHSDSLVRFLHPKELLAMDIGEDGLTRARWGSDMDIEKWLTDYSMDEIWRMGRVGGRS